MWQLYFLSPEISSLGVQVSKEDLTCFPFGKSSLDFRDAKSRNKEFFISYLKDELQS